MEKGREKDFYMKDSVAFMGRDMIMMIIEPPPPIIEQTPEQQIQQEPQITVEERTEFKETQTFYENPLYDDINLEDIYTNYSEDDFEEHKPPKKTEVF